MKPIKKLFDSEKFNLLLYINKPEIPEYIINKAKENGLLEKYEFHISILLKANSEKIKEFVTKNNNLNIIEKFIDSFEWNYSLLNSYSLHKKFYKKDELLNSGYLSIPEHTRLTVVQKVSIDNIDQFYSQLSQLIDTKLEIPKLHITLFSWSDYEPLIKRGIAICSDNDFKESLIENL